MACFDAWDIGACGCGPSVCNYTFCVVGMAGSALAGASIQIYTNSGLGTLVGSCTTDGTGCCTINVGSPGTYWEVITATHFNTWSGSVSVGSGSCGGSQTLTPVNLGTSNSKGGTGGGPVTGYTGCPACNHPVPKTLHFTCGAISLTLTFVSDGWYGTNNVSHWVWTKCSGSTFGSNVNYVVGETAFGTVTCNGSYSVTGSFTSGLYWPINCSFTITP
jgi:hypothetical protein